MGLVMNDVVDLMELVPDNLVERYPDPETRIYWLRDNYGVSLAVAFKVNTLLSVGVK